jgi:hypothetical protein
MCRDGPGLLDRAAREYQPNRLRHSHRESLILFVAICLGSFPSEAALLCVVRAVLFGSLQSGFFDQNPLTFIPLACPAETNYNRGKRAVLASTAGEGSITSGQIN